MVSERKLKKCWHVDTDSKYHMLLLLFKKKSLFSWSWCWFFLSFPCLENIIVIFAFGKNVTYFAAQNLDLKAFKTITWGQIRTFYDLDLWPPKSSQEWELHMQYLWCKFLTHCWEIAITICPLYSPAFMFQPASFLKWKTHSENIG